MSRPPKSGPAEEHARLRADSRASVSSFDSHISNDSDLNAMEQEGLENEFHELVGRVVEQSQEESEPGQARFNPIEAHLPANLAAASASAEARASPVEEEEWAEVLYAADKTHFENADYYDYVARILDFRPIWTTMQRRIFLLGVDDQGEVTDPRYGSLRRQTEMIGIHHDIEKFEVEHAWYKRMVMAFSPRVWESYGVGTPYLELLKTTLSKVDPIIIWALVSDKIKRYIQVGMVRRELTVHQVRSAWVASRKAPFTGLESERTSYTALLRQNIALQRSNDVESMLEQPRRTIGGLFEEIKNLGVYCFWSRYATPYAWFRESVIAAIPARSVYILFGYLAINMQTLSDIIQNQLKIAATAEQMRKLRMVLEFYRLLKARQTIIGKLFRQALSTVAGQYATLPDNKAQKQLEKAKAKFNRYIEFIEMGDGEIETKLRPQFRNLSPEAIVKILNAMLVEHQTHISRLNLLFGKRQTSSMRTIISILSSGSVDNEQTLRYYLEAIDMGNGLVRFEFSERYYEIWGRYGRQLDLVAVNIARVREDVAHIVGEEADYVTFDYEALRTVLLKHQEGQPEAGLLSFITLLQDNIIKEFINRKRLEMNAKRAARDKEKLGGIDRERQIRAIKLIYVALDSQSAKLLKEAKQSHGKAQERKFAKWGFIEACMEEVLQCVSSGDYAAASQAMIVLYTRNIEAEEGKGMADLAVAGVLSAATAVRRLNPFAKKKVHRRELAGGSTGQLIAPFIHQHCEQGRNFVITAEECFLPRVRKYLSTTQGQQSRGVANADFTGHDLSSYRVLYPPKK